MPEGGIAEGIVCDECVEMLGNRSERFPSLEDYYELLRHYPEPMFATDEEYLELERQGTWAPAHERSQLGTMIGGATP